MTVSRFLILDDDPSVGQTIELIAQTAGFETRFTQDPDEFFLLLSSWSPHVLAVDLVMPQMDGIEVLAQLARMGCTAKVIVTSGVSSRILDAASRSASERGLAIAGVLSKPFTPAALRALLGEPLIPQQLIAQPAALAVVVQPVLSQEIQQGLINHEFFTVFQPKIRCGDARLQGFEALLRWDHPQRGLVAPDTFIPVAEQAGLIDALTERVFDLAFRWFATHYAHTDLRLSVNISAKTVMDEQFVEGIINRCALLGLRPDQIICELTETSAMEDPAASLGSLTRLRMRGVHLSIDDLGTGFSSLLQLVRLPFSELKVDKSCVISARHSAESRQVIKAIVGLGASLEMQTTAEGVEDAATLRFLQDIGCNLAQGFHIARPMTGLQAVEWAHHYMHGRS